MTAGLFAIVILFDCVAAWLLSGSPVPMGISMLLIPIGWLARRFAGAGSRLTAICVVLVVGTAQWYLFRTGQANVFLAELPDAFHLGISLHWWCFLQAWINQKFQKKGAYGSVIFWAGLIGSALLIWVLAGVEAYEFPSLAIRAITALPFVAIIWNELFSSRINVVKGSLAMLALCGLVGFATLTAQTFSSKLYRWIKLSGEEEELSDYSRKAVRSGDSSNDSSVRELSDEADIFFTHQIRFYMQADEPKTFTRWLREPLYVRTSTVAVFETDNRIAPLRRGEWIYDSDDGAADAQTHLLSEKPQQPFSYSMLIHRSDISQLPLLPETHSVATDSVYEFASGWYQIAPREEFEWLRVQAFADSGLLNSEIASDDTSSPFLQLPDTELTRRIESLTKELTQSIPTPDRANAIRKYLQANCQYSLRYRNPNRLPPVENLLFAEKKGHCELFAAASVLMLRSAGIPSRIAYGYAGGQADQKSLVIAFRDSDFHSWPEIQAADGTWQIFDTTPRVPEAANRKPALGRVTGLELDRYQSIAKVEDYVEMEGSISDSILINTLNWMSVNFLPLLIGIAVIGLGFLLLRKRRNLSRGRNKVTISRTTTDQSGAFRAELSRLLQKLGDVCELPREKGQTLGEYGNQLRANGVGDSNLFDAIRYLYEIRYADGTRNPAEERDYLRKIRKMIGNLG